MTTLAHMFGRPNHVTRKQKDTLRRAWEFIYLVLSLLLLLTSSINGPKHGVAIKATHPSTLEIIIVFAVSNTAWYECDK